MSGGHKRIADWHSEPKSPDKPAPATPLVRCCRLWLAADNELEHLTLKWARHEERELRAKAGSSDPSEAAIRNRIETRIARIDTRRSRLLAVITELEAHSLRDVAAKLSVAEHLLAGEGGIEHRLVTDALRLTSRVALVGQ